MATFVLAPAALAQQTPKAPAPKPAAGAAQKAEAPGSKVVLRVGKEEVTEADIDFLVEAMGPDIKEAIKTQGRRQLGEQYATMIVLSQHATAQKLDATPEFRRRLALQMLQWLAETAVEQLEDQVSVAPEEVSKYYSGNPLEFEEVRVRQVVVRKKPEGAAAGSPGLSAEDARARAEEIRKALAGGKDWKALATELQGSQEMFVVADPRPVRRGQFPDNTNLETVIFGLKDGDFSLPTETPQAVIVFQSAGRRMLTLEEASEEIETAMRRFKVQQQINELRGKATIWMDEQFFSGAPAAPRQ
jgi:hypothetical protein